MSQITERWLFISRDHSKPEKFADTLSLLPRAKAAGYNTILLGDHYLLTIDRMPEAHRQRLIELREAIRAQGFKLLAGCMPVGYALSILAYDPNLAEGVPVKDALFVARGGRLEFQQDPAPVVVNGAFASRDGVHFDGWEVQEGLGTTLFVEKRDGAVRTEITPERCMLAQKVKVHPYRQYHIRVRTKIKGMDNREGGAIVVRATDKEGRTRRLNYACLRGHPDCGWREQHAIFNSFEFDEVLVGIGTDSEGHGTIWWQDFSLEETALVNLLRRDGCPLSVKGEDGTAYQEGKDFEPIVDALLDPMELYHTPPVVKLTAKTRIRTGARVRMSYYHPLFIYGDQVCACLSDQKVFDIMRDQVTRLNELLHPDAFLMSQDEMRTANQDAACVSRNMTPGQLMAENVRKCAQIIRDLRPEAKIWIWSDMLDPFHNAHDGPYYFVEGSWKGAWEGADPDIGIANWAGHLKGKNFKWFSDRGHQQVLCGYYDYDDDGKAIAEWLKAAEGIPGVIGVMHTSWQEKYGTIEAWAKAAWGEG